MRTLRASDIPNVISMLRLLTVVPIIYLLISEQFGWALVLFAVAGISDGVDGFLAKHYGWQTRLGGILDPLADKTLLVACFLVLGTLGLLPVWLVVAVIFRDLVIVGGAVTYHFGVEELKAAPLLSSKLNTLMQLLLVISTITNAGPLSLPDWLIDGLVWSCLATVVLSGTQYVWIWSHKAIERGWRRD